MGARIYIQFQFELRVEARSIFNRIAYNLQHFQWPFAPFTYLNLIKCKFCARSVLCECQWVEVWESRCRCVKGGERVEGFINSLRFSGFFEWFIRRWTESISTQLNWSMHLSDTLDDKQTKRFIYSTMSPYSAPWPPSLPLPFPFPLHVMQHTSLKPSHAAASASIIQAGQSILYPSRPSTGPNYWTTFLNRWKQCVTLFDPCWQL